MKIAAPFLLILFISLTSFAAVDVAFFEVRLRDGTLLQLEKDGRFAHVAIRVGNRWLHSHPRNGVELVDSLREIGDAKQILSSDDEEEISAEIANEVVGLPYDFNFNWDDTTSTYCSKLVAQILGVPPMPMKFDGPYWEKFKKPANEGQPGVSPDGLYRSLKSYGYSARPVNTCTSTIN